MEQLASITILTLNRQQVSRELNDYLTNNGHLVMSRLGVNIQKNCLESCSGMIILVIKSKKEDIDNFIVGLEKIKDLKVKTCVFDNK